MTDRPIIFSAPMVNALLTGRKTMTRRLLYTERMARNGIIPASVAFIEGHRPPRASEPDRYYALTPWHRVRSGDRLWVRENLQYDWTTSLWRYRADNVAMIGTCRRGQLERPTPDVWPLGICNSIHMPRWASRIALGVTATKIERLQDISEEDAMAEGAPWYVPGHGIISDQEYAADPGYQPNKRMGFCDLWQSLHGIASWADNPEVVALTFTVHQSNVDAMPEALAA